MKTSGQKPSALHTSQLLALIAERLEAEDSISLKDVIGTLGERVFGISILLFCIPNCLPIPNVGGLSALTGIPISIIGIHMILGRLHLWLPYRLSKQRFSGRRFGAMLKRADPSFKKRKFYYILAYR